MTRIPLSSSALAIIGFLLLAPPVNLVAQRAHQRGTASAEGQAVPQSERRGTQDQAPPAAQAETQRATEPARSEATRVPPSRRSEFPNSTAVPRPVPRVVTPQVVVPRVVQPHVEIGRPEDHPAYWPDYRPDYRPDRRPYYEPNYRPEYRRSSRPYYTFRPRVHLGFGLWVGYPVTYPTYFYPLTPYPYGYLSPYPNTYPYPTGIYPAPGTTAAAVGVAGGLSFEISPAEAGVYVDGQYVGMASQFSPNQPPLALAAGRHHVEIREPGFEIVAFDVDILPGQVIPYQGDLQRF